VATRPGLSLEASHSLGYYAGRPRCQSAPDRAHKTSVSLEQVYWKGLREIAEERGETLTHLIAGIDTDRQNENLSSAIRHFVLGFYRHKLDLSRMVA
jgi:predicted DNA-binding ribbon-helix-helix protein